MFAMCFSVSFSQAAFAQWMQTGGPNGGNIHALAVIGANLFAGTDDGVFLSANGGADWTEVDSSLTNKYASTPINALAASGGEPLRGNR